jgi:outer membrane autotransporter protein
VSAALAYGWHNVSTDRIVALAGFDHLTAGFDANNYAGRIEGGYRFALPSIPGILDLSGFGITPYGAFQMQAFHTPSYSETAVSGTSLFALNYDAHTTTTIRTELGTWFDRSFVVYDDAILSLRSRAAWAHDSWSNLDYTSSFQLLPGTSWTVAGAAPAKDLVLASGIAEVSFRNGISVAGKFETEQSSRTRTYVGTARVSYTW